MTGQTQIPGFKDDREAADFWATHDSAPYQQELRQVAVKVPKRGRGRKAMAREKKREGPVTLFAAIETKQHQALREIAFKERRSIADVVQEAISQYVARRPAKTSNRRPISGR